MAAARTALAIRSKRERIAKAFAQLPPLDSPEYLDYLRTAPRTKLPAEVLVQAYRQLVHAGRNEAATATRDRLFEPKYGYFARAQRFARTLVVYGQPRDLLHEMYKNVLQVLPGDRGAYAERHWVRFTIQRLLDAWRAIYGRRGEKTEYEHLSSIRDKDGTEHDPFEDKKLELDLAPWHARLDVDHDETVVTKIEGVIARVLAELPDQSLARRVAEDQWGPNPSPIDKDTRSAEPRTPLTEKLGTDRFRISRELRKAKVLLTAATLEELEKLGTDDIERLRPYMPPVQPKTKRPKS